MLSFRIFRDVETGPIAYLFFLLLGNLHATARGKSSPAWVSLTEHITAICVQRIVPHFHPLSASAAAAAAAAATGSTARGSALEIEVTVDVRGLSPPTSTVGDGPLPPPPPASPPLDAVAAVPSRAVARGFGFVIVLSSD